MEYIVIPTKDKEETTFFLELLKKLRKQASTLSAEEMEDLAFLNALKEGEASGKGDLGKVKDHLSRIVLAK